MVAFIAGRPDLSKAEREVRDDVDTRDDLKYRQLGQRRQRVREQDKLCRSGPGALQVDVLQTVFDELADARRAVDMRYDFEQEIGCSKRSVDTQCACLIDQASGEFVGR